MVVIVLNMYKFNAQQHKISLSAMAAWQVASPSIEFFGLTIFVVKKSPK